MPRTFPLLLSIALMTGFAAAQEPAPDFVTPVPDDENVEAWKRHILPSAADLAYEQIAWHPSIGTGIRESRKAGKPLLFWAMNGHPLGCT